MLLELIQEYERVYASGESHTAKAKRYDLRLFLDYMSVTLGRPPPVILRKAWTREATDAFVQFLLLRQAPATVARRLATLKHMGRVMAESISGFANPAIGVKGPKEAPAAPKALSKEQIDAMRRTAEENASRGAFVHIRNRALFEFMLATGIRADEARNIRYGQLTPAFDWVRRVKCKGSKYRNVYIKTELRHILKRYLIDRDNALSAKIPTRGKFMDSDLPLFPSTYNADPENAESFFMGAKTLWRAIADLCPGAHPHALRHTFAHDFIGRTGDVRLACQALGHSSVNTTMRYTERADEELAKAMEGGEKESA